MMTISTHHDIGSNSIDKSKILGSEPNLSGSKRPNSEFSPQKNLIPGQSQKFEGIPSRDHGESLRTNPSQKGTFTNPFKFLWEKIIKLEL